MSTSFGSGAAVPSDADLVRDQLAALDLSQREAARRLGIDDRTMRYYCSGKSPVPPVVFLALRELKQMRLNDRCLELLGDGTLSTSDGDATAERLRKANRTLRAAIEILLRPVRGGPDGIQERTARETGSLPPLKAAGRNSPAREPVSVEIRERGTFRLIGTYPVQAAATTEPTTAKKYADDAWAQAVAAGDVDNQRRHDFEILVSLVVFGNGVGTDLCPMTLHQGARGFATAADATVRQHGPLSASSPLYLIVLSLLGQSIEIGLKAFLQFRGYSEDQLRELGHDLARVLRRAREMGLPKPHHAADLRLLELLNDTYLNQRKLQYQRASGIRLPLLRPIRELATEYLGAFPISAGPSAFLADPAADYGEPSLADFRSRARGTDLRSPRLDPKAGDAGKSP